MRILSRKASFPFLAASIRRISPSRVQLHSIRSNHSTSAASKFATKRPIFPERLLIYHAGTGRSVFLGCLRVTTIFVFTFFTLVVAPTHLYAENEPLWIAGAVMASGTIPLLTVAYVSSPFVANIHLRLPQFTRYSRDLLFRYSQSLPKDAKLEITTMNFIGKPRVSLVKAADLHAVRERFGMVNYARDTKDINLKRPWWMGRAVRQFGVHGGTPLKDGSGIWDNISRTITKRSN